MNSNDNANAHADAHAQKNENQTESTYQATMEQISELSNAELDQKLEETAAVSERTEMLLCCYLAAVSQRRLFHDFGYSDIYDYTEARFGFAARKTRYLVSLGRKIDALPQIREALAYGKLGWVKASRIASVATEANEAMWLDSALSLSVKDLERRIKDGTDSLMSELRLFLTEDRRILWENALEIYRRRAGSDISPVEALELMTAEVIAEWSHLTNPTVNGEGASDDETSATEDESEVGETESETESVTEAGATPDESDSDVGPVFPWAEEVDTSRIESESPWKTEAEAEKDFARSSKYNAVRHAVLERDRWTCSYPGCNVRRQLHVHHIRFRSRGGCNEPWNLTVVCDFHHKMIHTEQIKVRGGAPMALEWTPPKLMREVFERRRNKRSIWVDELEIREWTHDAPVAATA